MIKSRKYKHSKGMALLIILLLVAAITIIGLGFIVRGDTELLCGQNMELRADMDSLAESGLEHAKGLIMYPQDLPGEPNKYLAQQLYAGSDYYDVNVTKLSECDWQIISIGYRQVSGNRTAQSSLTARMRLDPDVAFWSEKKVSLRPVMIINGDVYCDGDITNQGSINGDCFADSLTGNQATGSVNPKTDLQLVKPKISEDLLTSNFTTLPLLVSSLTDTSLSLLTVWYRNGNLEIRKNVTINGCLVVNGNLTVTGNSNEITAKKGVPAIFVSGKLIMQENAELNCSGLVFVKESVELPSTSSYANLMTITGSLFIKEFKTNGGIVADSSGNGYNGTMKGDCALVPGPAGFGTAIDLGGKDDDVEISGLLGQPSRLSICAWVNLRSRDTHGAEVISLGDYVSLRLDQDGTVTTGNYYRGGSQWNVTTLNKTYAGKGWHHFAYVIGNNTQILYVDGVAAASTAYNNAISYAGQGSNTTIGCHGNGKVDFDLNGIIDDVRVYNKALSQANILSIMAGGEPAGGSLVGCWNMECGTIMINAAPVKAAIYHWPGGVKDRWSPAAGSFYKSIARNP